MILDQEDQSQRVIIHRNLIVNPYSDIDNWTMDLRKTFRYTKINEEGKPLEGDLYLELVKLGKDGSDKFCGQIKLASFTEDDPINLFNYNFEILFNHIQVENKLYFFTVRKEADVSVFVQLNCFEILPEVEFISNNIEAVGEEIEFSAEDLESKYQEARLMGVVFIKGLEDHTLQYEDGGLSAYFAFVFAKRVVSKKNDEGLESIFYDVRHTK